MKPLPCALPQLVYAMLNYAGADQRQDDLFMNGNLFSRGKSLVKGLQGVENVYTQHKPHLLQTLDNLLKGRLRETSYPFLDTEDGTSSAARTQRCGPAAIPRSADPLLTLRVPCRRPTGRRTSSSSWSAARRLRRRARCRSSTSSSRRRRRRRRAARRPRRASCSAAAACTTRRGALSPRLCVALANS